MTRDPDWWQPAADDYAATFNNTEADAVNGDGPTIGEEYADFDTGVRFSAERGRPGYAHPEEDD